MDNLECLNLIEKRPVGVVHILAEHCKQTAATDETFIQHLHNTHTDHAYYEVPLLDQTSFTIRHYPGDVTYASAGTFALRLGVGLGWVALRCAALRCFSVCCVAFQYVALLFGAVALRCVALRCSALCGVVLHCIVLRRLPAGLCDLPFSSRQFPCHLVVLCLSSAADFLKKNRDAIVEEIKTALRHSDHRLVSRLFREPGDEFDSDFEVGEIAPLVAVVVFCVLSLCSVCGCVRLCCGCGFVPVAIRFSSSTLPSLASTHSPFHPLLRSVRSFPLAGRRL